LNYFRCKGLKNYKYLGNTVFDYGSLPRIMIKDIQIVAMFKAVILKTPQFLDVNNVLLSWHKGEVNRQDINRGYRVKAMFNALEVNREITLEFPIEHKTRAQMVAELPKELLSYVWSCRKPLNGKPCNKCKTCKEYVEEGLSPL
jgi:7-cyano-7-deazaguanine synthase in queuosine biosynthesis